VNELAVRDRKQCVWPLALPLSEAEQPARARVVTDDAARKLLEAGHRRCHEYGRYGNGKNILRMRRKTTDSIASWSQSPSVAPVIES